MHIALGKTQETGRIPWDVFWALMGFPSWLLLPSAVGRTLEWPAGQARGPGHLPPTLLQRLGCLTWGPWRWRTGGSAGPGSWQCPLARCESPVGEGMCPQEEQALLPLRCVQEKPGAQPAPQRAGPQSLGTRTRPRWHPRAAGSPSPSPGQVGTVGRCL